MGISKFIPKRSAILLIGPPRSEKILFANQFITEGIANNENSIYIITNNFPEDIIKKLSDKKGVKGLRIIDCYTIHAGIAKSDEKHVIRTSGPYALNEISIAVTKALKKCKPPVRVVFDSLSTLLLHNKPGEIEKFLEINIGKLKAKNSTTLFVVEEGVHDNRTMSLLGSLTDATIRFNIDNKSIYIIKTGEQNKINYKLDKGRIIMRGSA